MSVEFSDLIGIPFKTGGRQRDGMGCWGLVREVQRRLGRDVADPWEILASSGSQAANPGFFDAVFSEMEGRWDDVT